VPGALVAEVSRAGGVMDVESGATLACGVEGRVEALGPDDAPQPAMSIGTVRSATARRPNFANAHPCLF